MLMNKGIWPCADMPQTYMLTKEILFKIEGFSDLRLSCSSKINPELALGLCMLSKIYLRTGTV